MTPTSSIDPNFALQDNKLHARLFSIVSCQSHRDQSSYDVLLPGSVQV